MPLLDDELLDLARDVLDLARSRQFRLGTAESCTGGLLSGALTAIAGSSDVVEGAVVSYSNRIKSQLLGVSADLLALHGAVSEPVSRAMAEGAVKALGVDMAAAITGVAGPGGGTASKPVGLVHFAIAGLSGPTWHREMRFGDIGRTEVRLASVRCALQMLQTRLAS